MHEALMKILVCVKQVPDKDSTFRVDAAGTWVETDNLTFQLNDYDRFALEEALRLKDAGEAEVVVCSIGPERASQAIKTALAMGADRAVHVHDPAAVDSDALGLARILHAVAKAESFDLILAGLQAEDDNVAQVGPMLARLLDLPCATAITSLQVADDGKSIRVERELENNRRQVVDLDLPALVTVQTGINSPRYASLKGIMGAKRKEVRKPALTDLGLSAEQTAPRMRILALTPPAKGEGAEILQGSTTEVVTELVRRIKEKTGVI